MAQRPIAAVTGQVTFNPKEELNREEKKKKAPRGEPVLDGRTDPRSFKAKQAELVMVDDAGYAQSNFSQMLEKEARRCRPIVIAETDSPIGKSNVLAVSLQGPTRLKVSGTEARDFKPLDDVYAVIAPAAKDAQDYVPLPGRNGQVTPIITRRGRKFTDSTLGVRRAAKVIAKDYGASRELLNLAAALKTVRKQIAVDRAAAGAATYPALYNLGLERAYKRILRLLTENATGDGFKIFKIGKVITPVQSDQTMEVYLDIQD
jgi:hypothetical protein